MPEPNTDRAAAGEALEGPPGSVRGAPGNRCPYLDIADRRDKRAERLGKNEAILRLGFRLTSSLDAGAAHDKMGAMKDSISLAKLPLALIHQTRPLARLMCGALLLLLATPGASAGELIQNGSFTSGLSGWKTPEALGTWNPLQGTGWVSLLPSDSAYSGVVLYQNLNVSGASGLGLTFAVSVQKAYGSWDATLSFCVDYATAGGQTKRVVMLNPADAGITNGVVTNLSATVTLPAEAAKLLRLAVVKNGSGSFQADNFSLTTSGATAGAVPQITSVTPSSGPYYTTTNPVTITLAGTNFGAAAGEVWVGYTPVDYVGLGTPGGLAQVVSWNNTQIVARVVEPCRSGRVNVVVDKVESSGSPGFALSSPNFTADTRVSAFKMVRGQTATVVLGVRFLNGFSSSGGVSFQLSGLSGVGHNQKVYGTGGCSFDIPTSGLTNGVYQAVIQSTEANSAPRFVPISLQVVGITNIDFKGVTNLSNSIQGQFYPTYQLVQSDGTLNSQNAVGQSSLGNLVSFASSDPGVVYVLSGLWAYSNGVANVVFTSLDGCVRSLPVSVNAPASPAIIQSSLTRLALDNSGGDISVASWTWLGSPSSKEINVPSALGYQVTWGNPTTMTLTPKAGADPGQYEISLKLKNSFSGPTLTTAAVMLTVTNSASRGQIAGYKYVASKTGTTMASGTLEVYTAAGVLVTSKSLWNQTQPDYLASYLQPGTYKLRFVPDYYYAPLWYPNGLTFAQATSVQVQAGLTTSNVNFYLIQPTASSLPTPTRANGVLYFSIPTQSGTTYYLESAANLKAPVWQTVQSSLGDGTELVMTNAPGGASQKFYRLRLE